MITPGQTLENPVTGERFTFTDTAATTGGELLAFDFALRPGGAVPIPHVHPVQTERFEVVTGRMRFRVGLRTVHAGPGDVVEVAPGVMHAFANDGDEEARLRVEVRPATTSKRSVWIGWTCGIGTAPPGRSAKSNASSSPPVVAAVWVKVKRSPVTGFSTVCPGWMRGVLNMSSSLRSP